MARGVGGLVRRATDLAAQVPGAEGVVLQAVRDMFSELKQLRRENDRLRREIERLRQRVAASRQGSGLVAPPRRKTTTRPKKASTRTTATRRRAKRTSVLENLLS